MSEDILITVTENEPEIKAEEIKAEEIKEIEAPDIDKQIRELEERLNQRIETKISESLKELELRAELHKAEAEKLAAEAEAERLKKSEDDAALEEAIIIDREPDELPAVEVVEIIPAPEETSEPEKRKRSFI
jgi:TolA-binding protein